MVLLSNIFGQGFDSPHLHVDVLIPCVVMSSELKKVERIKKLPHEILASNVDGDMDCKNTRHSR